MPTPELTFLSASGEPEVVTIVEKEVDLVTITVAGPPGPAYPFSDPTGIPGASEITNMVFLPQADYDALTPKDPTTLYFTPAP